MLSRRNLINIVFNKFRAKYFQTDRFFSNGVKDDLSWVSKPSFWKRMHYKMDLHWLLYSLLKDDEKYMNLYVDENIMLKQNQKEFNKETENPDKKLFFTLKTGHWFPDARAIKTENFLLEKEETYTNEVSIRIIER